MKRRDRRLEAPPAEEAGAMPLDADERPSKSQKKRDMLALQTLGEELLALPPAKLRTLPITPDLVEAVELAQRIRSREGLRRQRQYIGRLMRDVDAEPLRAALARDGAAHRSEVALMHAAERWRERLLNEPEAFEQLILRHPAARAELGGLLEQARGEVARAQPGRGYRELYRALRGLFATDAATASTLAPDAPASSTPATSRAS